MLAIEELEAAYYGGIRKCAETTDDDGSGWDAAGLRAVEAAVRADQIAKDAAIAEDEAIRMPHLSVHEEIAAHIRAQTPAIVSEPSTPEGANE